MNQPGKVGGDDFGKEKRAVRINSAFFLLRLVHPFGLL